MSTAILICAGIFALLLIFELAQIVAVLGNIRETLDIIHRDLCINHDALVLLFGKKHKPVKQRDWRKTDV